MSQAPTHPRRLSDIGSYLVDEMIQRGATGLRCEHQGYVLRIMPAADARRDAAPTPTDDENRKEIERLRQELWVVATAIWENFSRREMCHWAADIRVSLRGEGQTPTITVERVSR